jgi:hypothetical protein
MSNKIEVAPLDAVALLCAALHALVNSPTMLLLLLAKEGKIWQKAGDDDGGR